jgi:uncharacterized protein
MVFFEQTGSMNRATTNMKNIELLVKPVSHDCNLACDYCFYTKVNSVYPGKQHVMSNKVMGKFVSACMEYSDGGHCTFCWQGGEPLLAGVDFYVKMFELVQKYGKPGQVVGNIIQTNGTLLNMDWIDLFKEYNFFVGVSLDGPSYAHNSHRGDSFDKTLQGARLLHENNVEFNILTVVTKDKIDKVNEIYDFFVKRDLCYQQYIPCLDFDYTTGKITDYSITPEEYYKFLSLLFDKWYNNGDPVVSVRLFDTILEILVEGKSNYCNFNKVCGDYLVVEHNGDVYPCDFFVHPDRKLGNITGNTVSELVQSSHRFGDIKKGVAADECAVCEWKYICNCGCLWYRYARNGKFSGTDYFCDTYKNFFKNTIDRFKNIAMRLKYGDGSNSF